MRLPQDIHSYWRKWHLFDSDRRKVVFFLISSLAWFCADPNGWWFWCWKSRSLGANTKYTNSSTFMPGVLIHTANQLCSHNTADAKSPLWLQTCNFIEIVINELIIFLWTGDLNFTHSDSHWYQFEIFWNRYKYRVMSHSIRNRPLCVPQIVRRWEKRKKELTRSHSPWSLQLMVCGKLASVP